MLKQTAKNIVITHLQEVDVRVGGGRSWDIQVNDDRFFTHVVKHGSLGAGESYVKGWWDCDQLDNLIAKVLSSNFFYDMSRGIRLAATIGQAIILNAQRGHRGLKVARLHYDLDPTLFEYMLGPTMNYSCGYWSTADNLDTAQKDKMNLICKKLSLKQNDRILDIGSGWGSLANFMATQYGCNVLGITKKWGQVFFFA